MVTAVQVAPPELSLTIAREVTIFGYSLLLGAILGVSYDFLRVLRKAVPHSVIMLAVEDIAYFLTASVYSFWFLAGITDGRIRTFALLGELLGAVVYYFTVGELVMRVSSVIIDAVKWVLRWVYSLTIAPIMRILLHLWILLTKNLLRLRKKLKKSSQNVNFRLRRRWILLYNYNKSKYIRGSEKRGEQKDIGRDRRQVKKADIKSEKTQKR